jgi:hypothetical protein
LVEPGREPAVCDRKLFTADDQAPFDLLLSTGRLKSRSW